MNKRIIIERMWFTLFIITFILAVTESFRKNIWESYPLFIVAFICLLMYILRKNIRKKMSNNGMD